MADEAGSPTLVKVTPNVDEKRPLGLGRWHSGVEKAVRESWNNGYDAAEAILKAKKDTQPRYALEYANLQCVRSLMNMNNESREKLLDIFQAADGLASSLRSKPPNFDADDADATEEEKAAWAASPRTTDAATLKKLWELECDICYADALMIRSVLQLTMNSYFRGGINLRKAWGCYYALLQELEKDTEGKIPQELAMNIKCGCGMFYIYMSLVPGSVMSILSAVGFSADRDLGESLLTEVVESNTTRSPTAAIVLMTFYLFLPTGLGDVHVTLAKVKPILDKMNNMLPDNSHFTAWANFYHRKLGQTDQALEMINKAVSSCEKIGHGIPTFLRYLQGDTLYMSLEYEQALKKYEEVLDSITKSGETFAYTGQLIISIAACHTWLGNKEKALELLKTVPKRYNDKSKQDANSPKYAARVNSEPRLLPLIGVYVLYINRDLAHMEGKYATKLQEDLTKVTTGEDMSPPEVRAMYWLFMGCMHKIGGRREEALRAWKTCRDMEAKLSSDSMVLPYVYYECGEYEYRNGNLETAKELLDKGQSLKGDGHETLSNRYNIAQKQLKKEMKKKGLL